MLLDKKKQAVIKEICDICGKPKSAAAESNVTRFLFKESRCNCLFDSTDPSSQPDAADVEEQAALDEQTIREMTSELADKYEVVSLLGKGGMGAVFRVRHKELGKTFAVKVLKSELSKDKVAMKRFEQEAKAASMLTHPNLVAVYDYSKASQGRAFLVMDCLEGQSLADIIASEGFVDAPRAVDIFIQVVEALQHAHQKNMIHRDVKPANIMVTKDRDGNDFVKVLDFGIAKVMDSKTSQKLTQTGEVFGSPAYMSPEQCLGTAIDARADIYSLGCVMYEALCGRTPFIGDNPIQTVLKHVNDPVPPLPGEFKEKPFVSDLEKVILQCLEKDPRNRYLSTNELLADLQSVRDRKKLVYLKTPVKAKQYQLAKRNLIVVACTLAMILATVSIFFVAFNNRTTGFETALGDAQKLDQLSYKYFIQGDYERAIPLLEFGIKTYREEHKNYEGAYLADNLQHVGKCYLKLKQYEKAEPYYKESLRIYKAIPRYGYWREAVADYKTVLDNLGRSDEIKPYEDYFKNKQ